MYDRLFFHASVFPCAIYCRVRLVVANSASSQPAVAIEVVERMHEKNKPLVIAGLGVCVCVCYTSYVTMNRTNRTNCFWMITDQVMNDELCIEWKIYVRVWSRAGVLPASFLGLAKLSDCAQWLTQFRFGLSVGRKLNKIRTSRRIPRNYQSNLDDKFQASSRNSR